MKLARTEELWTGTIGVTIVCLIFGAIVITAAGAWPWFVGWLNSANAAGWVQAVGSIGAIVGTMWAARHQVTQQAAEQERVRKLLDQTKLEKSFQIYTQLSDTAEVVIRQFAEHCKDPKVTANIGYFIAPLCASLEGTRIGLATPLLDELPTELVVSKFTVMTLLADLLATLGQVSKDFEATNAAKRMRSLISTATTSDEVHREQTIAAIEATQSAIAFNLMEARLKVAVRHFDEVEKPHRVAAATAIVNSKAPRLA